MADHQRGQRGITLVGNRLIFSTVTNPRETARSGSAGISLSSGD
jgi:hypothetical protein